MIVESPAKAKTIGKYLGHGYTVTASMGHIRDLPASTLGIDVEHGYTPKYITIKGKTALVKDLKAEAKSTDRLSGNRPGPRRRGNQLASGQCAGAGPHRPQPRDL